MDEPSFDDARSNRFLPVFLGIGFTALLLGLLAYLAQLRRSEEAAIPQLTIVYPAPNAAVDSPLRIRFTTQAKLTNGPSGWSYDNLHLHGWIDETPLMPAAADIRPIATDTFEWTLNTVQRGSAVLRLGWADAAHKPLSSGTSESVPVSIR